MCPRAVCVRPVQAGDVVMPNDPVNRRDRSAIDRPLGQGVSLRTRWASVVALD